ncbi:MAG: hypothetical protein PHZ00_07845 [Candidatus Peribacteraceae bacterium]|nr:hypothetical protein [Candidatus Peribacteraceae bacterium]
MALLKASLVLPPGVDAVPYTPTQPRMTAVPPEHVDDVRKLIYDLIQQGGSFEVIGNPNAPGLKDFYEFLQSMDGGGFGAGELEPIEAFQYEMSRNVADMSGRYMCSIVRDQDGKIASGAYGSVHAEQAPGTGGLFFMRFTATEKTQRKTGVSKAADDLVFSQAEEWLHKRGQQLRYCGAECVESSERYWNSYGMYRLYYWDQKKECLRELEYYLPHLGSWDQATGEPVDALEQPQPEHYQLFCGHNVISVEEFSAVLRRMWREWYVHRENFANPQAAEAHERQVMDLLETRILTPLRGISQLSLFSQEERESYGKFGMRFESEESPSGQN